MAEQDIDQKDDEVKTKSKYDGKPAELKELPKFDNAFQISSPLALGDGNDGLRARKGWHQTWKRDDEFRAALDVGYCQIRKQAVGKKQDPGKETGVILVRSDGQGHDEIAMEIPDEYYIAHINAMAAQSHSRFNDPNIVLQNFANKTGRDLSSRKEQISLSVDYDNQEEILH